jgi:hypothetical protein
MAIKNLANYRVGGRYVFEKIGGMGAFEAEISSKAYKKLQLKFSNDDKRWYSAEELTVIRSLNRKGQLELPQTNAKSEPKKDTVRWLNKNKPLDETAKELAELTTLATSLLDIDALIEGENVDEQKYMVQCLRRDLRVILKKHGWIAPIEWKIPKILGMIDAHLRDNPIKVLKDVT